MNRVTVKENLDACSFIQSVKGDILPYCFIENKSGILVQLGVCNAMLNVEPGDLSHSTVHFFLENLDRTMRKQLVVLSNANELFVFRSKENTGPANK